MIELHAHRRTSSSSRRLLHGFDSYDQPDVNGEPANGEAGPDGATSTQQAVPGTRSGARLDAATASGDAVAIVALRNALMTRQQAAAYGWTGGVDPCGAPSCSPASCGWPGLSCADGRIIGISLTPDIRSDGGAAALATSLQLSGPLPDALLQLDQLIALTLSGHRLSGALPDLRPLRQLGSLDLSDNQLYGRLPPQWDCLDSLDRIDVANNMLVGPVPQSWANMTGLRMLNVSGNPELCAYDLPLAPVVNVVGDGCWKDDACLKKYPAQTYAAPAPTPPPPSNQRRATGPSFNLILAFIVASLIVLGLTSCLMRMWRSNRLREIAARQQQEARLRQMELQGRQQDPDEPSAHWKRLPLHDQPPVVVIMPDKQVAVAWRIVVDQPSISNAVPSFKAGHLEPSSTAQGTDINSGTAAVGAPASGEASSSSRSLAGTLSLGRAAGMSSSWIRDTNLNLNTVARMQELQILQDSIANRRRPVTRPLPFYVSDVSGAVQSRAGPSA